MAARPSAVAQEIPGLTGLRGLGAVWVLLFHWAGSRGWRTVPLLGVGYLGVDLFFMLSGFVLTHVYFAPMARLDRAGYVRFLGIRLARIYPLYLLALLALAAATLVLPGLAAVDPRPERHFSDGAFFARLLLVQAWFPAHAISWNQPAWSVSVEWLAYLVFPLLLVPVRRVGSAFAALAVAIALLLAFVGALVAAGQYDPQVIVRGAPFRLACEFLAGCFLYRAHMLGLRVGSGAMTAAALALLGAALLPLKGASFLALFGFAVTLLLVGRRAGWIARFTETPAVMFLGRISYSIYMLHYGIMLVSSWLLLRCPVSGAWRNAWDAAMLLIVLGASWLSFSFVERPARIWGRQLAGGGWLVRPRRRAI
jgi:peptidoglycan/LPS O-acetylase OafA/YrhL